MPPRHARPCLRLPRLDLEDRARRYTREVGIAAFGVLLLGIGATAAPAGGVGFPTAARHRQVASRAVAIRTVASMATSTGSGMGFPASGSAPILAARILGPRAGRLAPWVPSGTGMWIHQWAATEGGHAGQVVARARATGLSVLYVQTGDSVDGWIGTPVLSQLLPATRGTGISVVAWDFPTLTNPVADALRLARAARFRRPGAPRVRAVAPDVETGSEGTRLSGRAIDLYYATLRRALPPSVGVLATVPWPSQYRVNSYPYARTSRHVDAFIPMAYWYNNSPGVVTATSMRILRRYGKPVLPVGQGYDGRLDAPYLKPDPAPDRSVQAFVDAARNLGAPAVSLWSWQTTGPKQWHVLAKARAAFRTLTGLSEAARTVGG